MPLGTETDIGPASQATLCYGDSAPTFQKGDGAPTKNWPMSIVAKRLGGSRWHLVRRQTSAQATLCQMGTQLPLIGARPQFSVYVYCGQTARWTKTPWYGSRPRPRPHCVRRGSSSPGKGAKHPPPSFRPMSIVATVAHFSYC